MRGTYAGAPDRDHGDRSNVGNAAEGWDFRRVKDAAPLSRAGLSFGLETRSEECTDLSRSLMDSGPDHRRLSFATRFAKPVLIRTSTYNKTG